MVTKTYKPPATAKARITSCDSFSASRLTTIVRWARLSPARVGLDQGTETVLASHGLQWLHAVQALQDTRHEGFLELGLIPTRATGYTNEPAQRDQADCANDEDDERDLPGDGDGERQVDNELNHRGENAASGHIGVGGPCRLDTHRARQIAGPLIHEVRPARPEERTDKGQSQVHRDVGGGVAHLRHGQQYQQGPSGLSPRR